MKDNNTGSTNNNQPIGSQEGNIREYIAILLRGKWIILLITLAVFGYTVYVTLEETPIYEATTSTLLNTRGAQQENIFPGLTGDMGKNIRNEMEILKSRTLARSVAEAIVEKRFLDDDNKKLIPIITERVEDTVLIISSPDRISGRLQRSVSFTHVRDSDILLISARSSNPREAALISQMYAQVYYKRNHDLSRAQSASIRQFLETQLREREIALQETEARLQRYMEVHGIVLMDDESRRVVTQLAQLEARREELEVEIQSLTNNIESLREQLTEHEPGVARDLGSSDNPYITRLQTEIAQLEVQRDITISQNPEVVGHEAYNRRLKEIDNQLNSLRNTLRIRTEEFLRTLTPGDAGYLRSIKQRIIEGEIELQGLILRKDATARSTLEYERQFEQLPQMNMDYARLQRARQSNEQLYLFIEQRYNEALIAEQSEFGIVEIIDPALVPYVPISPNVQQNLLQALIIGLGLGVAFVFGREALSSKIKTPEDLRKKGFTPLTTIGQMNNEVKRISRNQKVSIYGRTIDGHIINISNPLSPIAESFRWLRTNLEHALIDAPVKSVLVTSPNPSEGKSTAASNLAVAFAQAEKKVLLVDADLRAPTLHNLFDVEREPGLTDILFGKVSSHDAIHKTVVENLDILNSGFIPTNPSEILSSEKMKLLIDSLKQRYDIVIFDSPPVLAATDPSILSPLVDGTVIVIYSRKTKFEELYMSKESIDTVGGKIFGVVINRFDHKVAYGYSYAYKYYKYGKYGMSSGNGKNNRKQKETIRKG